MEGIFKHPDHMGGFKAARKKEVILPDEMGLPCGQPCFLPAEAKAIGFKTEVIKSPRMLAAGIASTGPLTRSLFLLGWTEEQAIVARLKDKGLVVLTGCGHPTIETIIQTELHYCRSWQAICSFHVDQMLLEI